MLSLGMIAYNEFGRLRGWKDAKGNEMRLWDTLPAENRQMWEAIAGAVEIAVLRDQMELMGGM